MQQTIRPDPSPGYADAPSRSYQVVSIMSYLIGVSEEYFGRDYLSTTYDTLHANPKARIIRSLTTVRNALMKHYVAITNNLRNYLTNIDKMPEFIDPELFQYLRSQNIELISPNRQTVQYIAVINQFIANNINQVQPLFPMWVKWEYIRPLFTMSTKEDKITSISKTFSKNLNSYPFHCYMDWPITRATAFHVNTTSDKSPLVTGNVLLHDAKFLTLLYRINNDVFVDRTKVSDVSSNTKDALSEFINSRERIAVIVDCENSDPYRLIAVIRNIQENCIRSGNDYQKIQKIILYDDPHTVDSWRVLQDYLNIPLEHEMVDRINDHKSLVDIKMTAGACKEHYIHNIDGFLLASSDSDFWALISSLPKAGFLVLAEKEKLGHSLRDALSAHQTPYCLMDEFSGNLADIKVNVLKRGMETYLAQRVKVNVNEMLYELYATTRMNLTAGEKETFYQKYVKSLRVRLDSNGDLKIEIAS